VRWISLGVLAAAGVVLALLWGDVPARWAIHWGLHDRPDGWATKSIGAAVGPLVIGFLVWLLIELTMIWVARTGARRTPALPPEIVHVRATVARAAGLVVAMLTADLALALPLLRPRSSLPILAVAFANIGIVVAATSVWAARETRRLRAAGVAVPEGHHGAFYSNPGDPRLWVPKLAGVGWTINFAHKRAWPALIALVGVPLALVLILALLAR